MKKLIILAACAACVSVSFAEPKTRSGEFLKSVTEASGGPDGIKTKASKTEYEAQLAALQALLPGAPDQVGIDAANANICVLMALLGRTDEALQVADNIQDTQTREKRKLHITHIAKGKDAAVAKLKELLASPQIPPEDHVIYVEKLVNVLGNDAKKDEEVVEFSTSVLEKTQFKDDTARVGLMLVKFQQKAVGAGAGDKGRTRKALEDIVANTKETEKTKPLLDAARETIATIPAH